MQKHHHDEPVHNSTGIPFCPFNNMVHLPKENLLDFIFTGKEG